ncbi:membrane-associating domain-containing [Fusarium albosuccineum]|uniref:Membrane-associating domain-containing n=1 Tax=Fusarium albosuccineum TaxID=1237068 RepID=A0A8H4LMW8_9HYPO|nr:membrane-associating domain-containing [Fusarium albosuccineum]
MGVLDLAVSYVLFSTLHLFCFALALTTCGLYGTDIHHANQAHKYSDSKWVYAVVVGSISAVTCVLYFIPFVLRIAGVVAAVWNLILFILWIALFGVFGKVWLSADCRRSMPALDESLADLNVTHVQMYINEDAEGDSGVQRMKNAVWVDLASALLWFIATLAAFGYWWKHRDTRSRFTGRAHV